MNSSSRRHACVAVAVAVLLWVPVASAPGCSSDDYAFLGCYHDHEPSFSDPKFVGPRLLTFGLPDCSGWGGCGDTNHPKTDCPPWPAAVDKCEKPKMTLEYCASQCLTWQSKFTHSGVANGNECWCGAGLSGITINTRVDGGLDGCDTKCPGDGGQMCGGVWFVSVSKCESSAWGGYFLAAFVVGIGLYVVVGLALGKNKGRGARAGGQGWVLAAHPHYDVWKEVGALFTDGVNFAKGAPRRRRVHHHENSSRREALLNVGDHPASEGSSNRRSKKKGSKSKDKKKQSGAKSSSMSKPQEDHPPLAPAPMREWAPTRTGHLAIGARETGVKVAST
jgi:hypothetical protein